MKRIAFFANTDNPTIMRMTVSGLMRSLRPRNVNLELFQKISEKSEGKRLRSIIREFCPNGLVASYTEGLLGLVPKDLPIVWIDVAPWQIQEDGLLVMHDAHQSAELAARELARLSLPHFAAVGFCRGMRWSGRRIGDFEASMRKKCPSATFERLEPKSVPEDRVACHREIVAWLRRLPRPCGVFAVCDRVAVNVLSAAATLGLRVPDDIAVVGVDNDENLCLSTTPTLTSVATDWEKAGFLAGEAVLRQIDHPGTQGVRATFGDFGIVRRASTSPRSARVDPRVADASVYIRAHACEGIGVADVVKRMGCSRSLAESRYLQATGHSIFHEIREAKFEQVLVLLSRRDVPIGVIADMCGWKSPLSLRRYFESRTHMTLGEWRRKKLGKA